MRAPELASVLIALGATHVLGIADNDTAPLFDHLQAHGAPTLLPVTREGEAFAIASGLWIGGARPVVVNQNTGLLESGDSLRGTAMRMGVPLLCLIGYRGHAKMTRAGIVPSNPSGARSLQRSELDSAALLTEPTLRAWGVPFEVLRPGAERDMLTRAWKRAQKEHLPVAVLLTAPFCR